MLCASCGAEVRQNSKFCTVCGKPLQVLADAKSTRGSKQLKWVLLVFLGLLIVFTFFSRLGSWSKEPPLKSWPVTEVRDQHTTLCNQMVNVAGNVTEVDPIGRRGSMLYKLSNDQNSLVVYANPN